MPQIDQTAGNNLLANKIWNHDHIQLHFSETKNLSTPKSIYDFVSNKLKYDFQKLIVAT